MDTELQKLVESGKLTSKAAEQLEKLKPGTFCLHRSWGFGRVAEWNLLLNQIVIDFTGKKSHPMQVQYAAENLTPLASEHFLARKANDLALIKKLAGEDRVALVRNIIESRGGQATAAQIGEWLVGDVLSEAEWKRWWESTKKLLKVSGAFSIPEKKTAAKEIRVLQALPSALGPRWTERALQLMQGNHGRMVAQIPRILSEAGQHAELRTMLERSIREHSATSEMLAWLCSERERWSELITPELLGAIFATLERDQHNTPGRASKLHRALVEDRQLLGDIFKKADVAIARDAMRRLQLSPLFDELTKRSLLARIVKVYPELESMITGAQPREKTVPLIVSWSSLEKRKIEYEELVKVKILGNSKEIALARSYGDLSENFEFKAAKQMQSVLMRRKAELEQMLHNARGTSFENVDTSRVSIGTIVTLRNAETNKEETYNVLGAWDGDPDRHIISYQTAIGQALLGHEIGENVPLNTEHGTAAQFTIISIQPAPPDQTEHAPNLRSESAVEAAIAE